MSEKCGFVEYLTIILLCLLILVIGCHVVFSYFEQTQQTERTKIVSSTAIEIVKELKR